MAGNVSDDPYADAGLYDLEYADHDEDVPYYQSIAWQASGPILELGCGTGRLAIPMAHAGAQVVGVDLAPAMLEGLRRRLDDETPSVRARIELHQGDFRTLRLGRRFPVVLWPFNALHHCEGDADLDAALLTIREHLEPGGLVALDAYLPDLELYDRDPDARFEERDFIDPVRRERVYSWEQGWWDAENRVHHVVYHYRSPTAHRRAHIAFRMWELDELRAAWARHGFTVEHEAEDFRSTPLGPASLKYVVALRGA